MESFSSEFAQILEEYRLSTEGVEDKGYTNEEQVKKLSN